MSLSNALRSGGAALALLAVPAVARAQAMFPPSTPNADALAAQMRVLAANPRDLSALIAAGELSTRLGDTAAALGFFGRAQAIDPGNPRIAAGRAGVLVLLERPGEALRLYADAEASGLSMTPYLAQRGLAHDLVGQNAAAQRDYRRALQISPDDETVRRLALSLGIAGERDEALALIDPLVRRNDRGAWRARACILALGGDIAEAEAIAAGVIPGGAALGPFFRRLAGLSPADRAFAVHFGQTVPTATRLADARLTPPPPVMPGRATARAPVTFAGAEPARERDRRGRRRGERTPTVLSSPSGQAPRAVVSAEITAQRPTPAPPAATRPAAGWAVTADSSPVRVASLAAPTPTPTSGPTPAPAPASAPTAMPTPAPAPPDLQMPPPATPAATSTPTVAASAPLPSVVTPTAAEASTPASAPAAFVSPAAAPPASAERSAPAIEIIDAPRRRVSVPVAAPPPPPAPPPRPAARRRAANETLLASIIGGITVPASELEIAPPPSARVAATPKSAAKAPVEAKKAAPAAETKTPEAKPKAPAAKAEPPRWWVQVAGGARAADLHKDWSRLAAKAPAAFRGKSAWTTPLRATNRLLAGPFRSEDEAQLFVNAIAKDGISGFAWQSEAGQVITKLSLK